MTASTSSTSSKFRFAEFKKDGVKDKKKNDEDDKTKPNKGRSYYLKKYIAWLWPYRGSLGIVLLLAIAGVSLSLVLPWATKHIIDTVLIDTTTDMETKIEQLVKISAIVAGLILLAEACDYSRAYKLIVLSARIIFSLREKLYRKLIYLPLGDLQEMKTGGIVSRLSSDVENVRGLIMSAIISPSVAFLRLIATIGMLFWINWQMALAALVLVPVLGGFSLLYVRKARPVYRSMAKDRTEIDGRVSETFGGIRVVRSFRRERREQLQYALGHHTIIRKDVFAGLIDNFVGLGWGFFIPTTSLVTVFIGGYLYLENKVSIGDIVAFQMYSSMVLNPVWNMVVNLSQTQRCLASMERVFDILERDRDKPDRPDAKSPPETIEKIEFKDVSFAYKKDAIVIKNVSFAVDGRSVIAFVGASGAGKTTLTDLIARFYDPDRGSIELNGEDLRDFKLNQFRSKIGIVEQDVFLFDGTVKENISYGRPDATVEEIVDAARRANADSFIMDLQDGYDTLIGERGVKLSGGQKQRLSIARAILADPAILILDEATSNLDTESEQHIQTGLKELFKNRITFVIAHRLSTITSADKILVVDDGKVVESGKHDELMSQKGHYHAMVERQKLSISL